VLGGRFGALALILALASIATILPLAAAQTLQWDELWGGWAADAAFGVSVSPDGNVYIAGHTYSFGAGNGDAFLAKYSSGGGKVWDRLWGGAGYEEQRGVIAVSPDGNYVYIAGYTKSFGAGDYDGFLAKYSSGGSMVWDELWGGAGSDAAHCVAVSPNGNYVYIAGTGSFGAGGGDGFLAKYSSGGGKVWDRLWGGAYEDVAYGVAVSPGGTYVYITGKTQSFGTGEDAFLARYGA